MKKPISFLTASLVLVAIGLLTGCQKDNNASISAEDAAKATPYPLKVCIVSDEALGSMGDPVVLVHAGQEVKFCCKDCIKEFQSEPAKFLAKLKPAGQADSVK